ncbi:MAG: hypothetical protein GAK37_00059 [Pseudomonas sp.]|nr:MAG: hypothetical protein GAK37_00059 [Pseudomonas sp.]
MPRPYTFLKYQLNRSRARAFANATIAQLTGGIATHDFAHVRFEAIDSSALDGFQTWDSPCFSWDDVVQWKAKELMYFDVSIWLARELCGLCFANPNHSRLRMRVVRLEASSNKDHPLRGRITPLALIAVNHYASIIGSQTLEIQEPEPEAIPTYQKNGFTFDSSGRLVMDVKCA